MQIEETVVSNSTAAKVVSMNDYGSRRKKQAEKQRRRFQTADDKFASLDEMRQRGVLSYVIGYIEAARDMISSGRQARTNEVSLLFGVIEESINES
ncbi:MAG: hypothetical protein K2G55_10555 [Lachnospiraceae bacterium]|nr:hypothetical protein [Lachnospiraceae bacterium]MDE7204619.1 hypothetical protein [Lachnospiraceae bacterium]